MQRRTARPRPSYAQGKTPAEEKTLADIYARLPRRPLTETEIRDIVRSEVLKMKAEGLVS